MPHPTFDPWLVAAEIRLRAGDIAGGFDCLLAALVLNPERSGLWVSLAGLGLTLGLENTAARFENCAIHIEPSAGAFLARSETIKRKGQITESAFWLKSAICFDPALADAWLETAQRIQSHMPAQALIANERAFLCGARTPQVMGNRADLIARLGDHATARELGLALCAQFPLIAKPHVILGTIDLAQVSWVSAGWHFARALVCDPVDISGCIGLSTAAGRTMNYSTAGCWADRAIAYDPANALGWNARGIVLRFLGLAQESYDAFCQARSLAPGNPAAYSNIILASCYLPEDEARDQRLLRDFSSSLPRTKSRPQAYDTTPFRALNIGYVSADFRSHPVGVFLAPVLESHDPKQVRPILYASQHQRDAMTARLSSAAPIHFVPDMSDEALADRIIQDRIDILVDLSGHTAGSRLSVFARRPALVQLTWGGMVGSSGLAEIDGIIADSVQIPDALAGQYVEPVIHLHPDYACFAPPAYAPAVASLPALTNGFVTFGSLNNILKISDQTIELWAEILSTIAGSKLLMRGPGFDHAPTIDRLTRTFKACGAPDDCLIFEGPVHAQSFLATYGRIDIALDPLSYSGGLTTMEALWMGVPVLTLPGRRFTSRHSASHLSTIGLDDWVCDSREDYVARAFARAVDLAGLSALRANLRPRMQASPLCDGTRMARQLENIYRAQFQRAVDLAY